MGRKIATLINDDLLIKGRFEQLDRRIFLSGAKPASLDGVTFETLRPDLTDAMRFVSIGNQSGKLLGNFVASTFGPFEIYPVTQENIRGFSAQLGDYSALVMLTNDVQRAKRIMRDVRAITQNKLCYAIMEESTPPGRAALMRQYFHDVFDLRTDPAEIFARISSHFDRQQQFVMSAEYDAHFAAFCEENLTDPIHYLQAPLLRRLFENMGDVVRYRDLAEYDFHSGEFRIDSLAVRIHNLRRKLKNYDIRSKRGKGYVLVKLDG